MNNNAFCFFITILLFGGAVSALSADVVWNTPVTIDGAGQTGQYPSLALDSGANPRVSYYRFDDASLRYASRNAGTWTNSIVDAPVLASSPSLALNGNDNVGVS